MTALHLAIGAVVAFVVLMPLASWLAIGQSPSPRSVALLSYGTGSLAGLALGVAWGIDAFPYLLGVLVLATAVNRYQSSRDGWPAATAGELRRRYRLPLPADRVRGRRR